MIGHDGLAVIERQRQGPTYYVLSGGGIEPGETTQGATTRKALEETGLHVEIIGPVAADGAHPRAIMERMGHSTITVTLGT